MAGACWHEEGVVAFDLVGDAVDQEVPLALLDAEKLIAIGMNFLPDIVSGAQRHQDELKMLARVEDAPKIGICLGEILNVADETLHDGVFLASGWSGLAG